MYKYYKYGCNYVSSALNHYKIKLLTIWLTILGFMLLFENSLSILIDGEYAIFNTFFIAVMIAYSWYHSKFSRYQNCNKPTYYLRKKHIRYMKLEREHVLFYIFNVSIFLAPICWFLLR